ncbi:MAG: DUF927 domain-containing protein [Prevotellaceae bacterium]|nr:DUF927 domain-containing protein [Prevotellaceae bacterium]
MKTEIAIIPDFTAEQYYNSSDPYEWLYQYKNDKFLMKQLMQKMKEKAGAVGVKCFVSLFNAYCETVASKAGISLDNSTQFEGQPVELFSGQYKCEESGVYFMDKFGYEVNVCRHPIMPIQRLCNADTGEERLEIAYKKGKNWRTVIVEKSVIASSSSILQLASYGILVNSENAKALSTYILEIENLNFDVIPEQQSIGRLGWISKRHFSPYVEELVFDGETNFKHMFNAIKSCGNRETWLYAMRDLRKEKSPGRLFLAASFASVILEPCGLLPFFLHAWGGTEVGKTVGLMIAASVWGSPRLGDFILTFNSTSVGQEMTASFLNSLPMCIDELQIQSSAGIRDFDRIIYQLTEGVGRTRGAKTGGLQRMNTWRNCIITNGEHPISNSSSGGGAVNRVIEFECDEKVYSDLVGICAVISQNYGFAGREFVEFLQQDGMFEAVNAIQKEYYRELLKSDSTDKQAASASAILAADAIATELIFKDGNNLTVADLEKIMTKKAEVNVNQRALEFVYELAERNPNRFKANEFGDYQGEVWGKKEDDCIYFIKSVFDREMANAGFNSTAFLAWAKRMGYIDTDKNKRTKKAWILGGSVNTVCVKKEKQPVEVTTIYDDELPL